MADLVTSMTMNFFTPGSEGDDRLYGKDDDTVITIRLLNSAGVEISKFHGYGGGKLGLDKCEFLEGSNHEVPLPVPPGFSFSDFDGPRTVFFRIDTNGNDKWQFIPNMTIYFQTNPPLTMRPKGNAIFLTQNAGIWQGLFY